MKKRILWKKAEAETALRQITEQLAAAFNIPAPECCCRSVGANWSWRFDTVEVWTKAGRAECSIDISARFAHLYFRFSDPARAVIFDTAQGRLNHFSGKRNNFATADGWLKDGKPCPATALSVFVAECRRDFRKVAEPNPDPAEVAAYRESEAARAAQWAQYVAEMHTTPPV